MSAQEIAIHRVTISTAALLDRVDPDVFDNKVQPDLARRFLADPASILFVAVVDGEVVGMASGLTYVHPDKPLQLFVNEVGVSARFHRRGIGSLLLSTLLRHGKSLGCREAWVATEVSNVAARGLYAALGGKEDDEQAVVYVYSLEGDQT